MKQIALSMEQMAHLESLGLDTSDASMYYLILNPDIKNSHIELRIGSCERNKYTIPAYTIQDIIDKLPFNIDDNDCLYELVIKKNIVGYQYDTSISDLEDLHYAVSYFAIYGNILEALYKLLVWYIKSDY